MEFASKGYFLLLLLLIPYLLWYFLYRKKSEPTMQMSDTYAYRFAPKSWRMRIINLPMLLRCLTFIFVVIALARPQTHNSWDSRETEGIDIMLAMDVSTSMLAEDLRPNRMEAAKSVAGEFISGRPNDNIGLTIFAGEAFTQCPMTTDHQSLLNLLQGVRTDIAARGLISDGTAVGMGLANAVSRLKDSKAKSKVVILLTDGSNNMGDISPMTAAQIANPWREITEAEATVFCPKSFRVPEGAQNVRWSVMDSAADPSGVPGALVQLSFDLNSNSFTAREQITGDEEVDQSGMYYECTARLGGTLRNWNDIPCICYRWIGEAGYADLCTWYEAEAGTSYSVSVTAEDLDGFDLQAIAEALAP